MLDNFKIKSFAWSNDVYYSGLQDFRNGNAEITSVEKSSGGDLTIIRAKVREGDSVYQCAAAINGERETVMGVQCSCPKRSDAFGYCRHICAALLKYIDQRDKEGFVEKVRSSAVVSPLIRGYSALARSEAELMCETEKVTLEPVLSDSFRELQLSFRIGMTRRYVVRNIYQLAEDFANRNMRSYGKGLEFVHNIEMLDEIGKKYIDFVSVYCSGTPASRYGYYSSSSNKRSIPLNGIWAEKFFTAAAGSTVNFNGEDCMVKEEDPQITVVLKKRRKKDVFYLTMKGTLRFFSSGSRCCIYDDGTNTFRLCTKEFSRNISLILDAFSRSRGGEIDIAESDMKLFCSAVLEPLKKYITVVTQCDISGYALPEAEIRLYLDSPSDDEVCGRLEYTYGDETFTAFDGKSDSLMRDVGKETAAEYMVLKYFEADTADAHHPLKAFGADNIYRLFSEGIPKLTKLMEIFASERFNRMNIRPPVYPSVGVRPESSLLVLDIGAEGYDVRELAEMLSSYRRGMKYHRLRDGSFVDLSQGGIEAFSELADGLDLSDKALLKEKITVPRYRMLYLDSLRREEGSIRIKRSEEFRKTVRAFSDISSSEFLPPEPVGEIMREYQVFGYRWMRTIAAYGFGGILADDMGLGKTLQAIAVMLAFKQENEKSGGGHRVNLVVCPSSLTLNWESEIKKFAPQLKTAVIIGTASQRTELIEGSADADVMITSYSMLTRDLPDYIDIHFFCQFIDEAQFIKNHNTQSAKAVKSIKSDVRFALTGTPVENSLAELWSIYDFVMPEYLFNYNHFKKTFETPIVRNSSEKSAKALKKLTSPFILRRLKRDVLTELPEKTEISLSAEMTEEQSKLYAANVLSMKRSIREKFSDASGSQGRFEILAMLTRLRQICCDPSLVYENYGGGSGKLEQCAELVDSCINSGHKVLLFSQFTSMLDIIARRFDSENIRYYMLTGATKAEERLRMVNSFNSDDTPVFMISLKAGGTGLNLTGADIVIHYDPWWNVSAENQAADRAYRIGQHRNVTVYKLITKKTIEEKITELQKQKSELAELAVSGEGDIMHMTPADIMKILE